MSQLAVQEQSQNCSILTSGILPTRCQSQRLRRRVLPCKSTHAKPLQAGFASRTGVEAALLAKADITGNPDIIENERGFTGIFGAAGPLVTNLGDPWALVEHGTALKP